MSRACLRPPSCKDAGVALGGVDAKGRFCGYASLFGVADLGRDMVMPGAFAQTLKARGAGGIKMLYQHDPAEPIGLWREIVEDARGLRVEGQLMLELARAREVHALMRAGVLDGLSIGFRTLSGRRDAKSGLRRLYRIDLWEISLVTFPMQEQARVGTVRSAPFARPCLAAARAMRLAASDNRQAANRAGHPAPFSGGSHQPQQPTTTAGNAMTSMTMIPLETKAAPDPRRAPETKVVEAPGDEDADHALDELMRAFEEFKQSNDDRLAELETRSADAVTEDKLARISAGLDELMLKARRPGLAGTSPSTRFTPARFTPTQAIEHRSAFEGYMRSGREDRLRRLEEKALSVGSDPDGGYLVPEETERAVLSRLAQISPIRAIAGNRQVSASVYKKPYATSGAAVGWVGETDARPQTATPSLAELSFPTMELYAMPAATATLLEDAAVNVDEWIAAEVETAFAEQEGAAFVNGDGVNKPRGFLDYPTVDEGSWAWGSLGTVPTGVAGAFPASDASDVLIDLVYALKSGHRQNAHWVMNRATQAEIRKLKDADGNYLWQPPATAGANASLMNFAIAEAEDMPDISADSTAVAFGDFSRGYLVVDRMGVRVLRDPYSAKPYVLFYTTKRVGGGVQDFDAIKLLKFGVS